MSLDIDLKLASILSRARPANRWISLLTRRAVARGLFFLLAFGVVVALVFAPCFFFSVVFSAVDSGIGGWRSGVVSVVMFVVVVAVVWFDTLDPLDGKRTKESRDPTDFKPSIVAEGSSFLRDGFYCQY